MLAHVTTPFGAVTADPWSVAFVVLVWGVAALVVVAVLAGRAGRLRGTAVPFALWSATIAAGLSLGAAAIHFAAIGDHFAEYAPYGIAFAALAWFQVAWAIACLFMPSRSVAVVGVVVNVGALVTWVASRTVGLPFGPEAGQIEPVGPLDVVASTLEIVLVGVLAWDLGAVSRRFRPALPGAGALVVLGSSALAVVLMTTTAFAVSGGDPHGGADHEAAAPGLSPLAVAEPSTDTADPSPGGSSAPGATPTESAPVSSPATGPSPSPLAASSPLPSTGPDATPLQPAPSATVARPSRQPTESPPRSTPVTPTATPARTTPPSNVPAGAILFGTGLSEDGALVGRTSQFGEGQTAVWIAQFRETPGTSTVWMFIVQVLPDGREFEHWREEVAVADQAAKRFVGRADLSIYLHGGDGSFRLRYVRGDELLAEGAFDLVH